jgi:AcrR family transcriptional regulator
VAEPSRNRWRGVPADARTAERRAALIDVAFDLVGSDGMAGTTVRKVCEVARLNPRYFYESFEDLDALVVAVFDRTATEAFAAMAAAVAAVENPEDPEAIGRAGIGSFVRHLAEDPRRARVLFVEGLTNEALGRRRFDTLHDLTENMQADARARALEETGSAKLPSIVIVATNLLVGGMAELLISFIAGRLDVTLDELVEDSTALFVGLVGALENIHLERERRRAQGDGPEPGDLLHQS